MRNCIVYYKLNSDVIWKINNKIKLEVLKFSFLFSFWLEVFERFNFIFISSS